MKAKPKSDETNEVVGIVIHGGKSPQVKTRLSLYMWCDDPDTETDSSTRAA